MAVDIVGYLESIGVDLKYSGQNVPVNDVAIQCPWCDDPSYHLTIHRTKGILNCWRCDFVDYISNPKNRRGYRPNFKALIRLLEDCSWREANQIWVDIGGDTAEDEEWSTVERVEHCELPEGCYTFDDPGPYVGIRDYALRYLQRRGFGWDHIEKYCLMFTAIGWHQHRIIVPVFDYHPESGEFEMVNWLGRSFTKEANGARYMNCRLQQTTLRLSETLYGRYTFNGEVLRLVEGAFDKMKVGDTAIALNRSQFSSIQRNIVLDLSKEVDYISVILDPEADHRSLHIAEQLSPFRRRIKMPILPLGEDPASMTFDDLRMIEESTPFLTF